MATGGNAIRGTRVGAGPMGEQDHGHHADRVAVSYWDALGNETVRYFAAGIAGVAWEAPAISALIKECIGKHGLKMPKLAMPLRVLLTGQAQTPSVDAVIALFPREVVQKRLSVAV